MFNNLQFRTIYNIIYAFIVYRRVIDPSQMHFIHIGVSLPAPKLSYGRSVLFSAVMASVNKREWLIPCPAPEHIQTFAWLYPRVPFLSIEFYLSSNTECHTMLGWNLRQQLCAHCRHFKGQLLKHCYTEKSCVFFSWLRFKFQINVVRIT